MGKTMVIPFTWPLLPASNMHHSTFRRQLAAGKALLILAAIFLHLSIRMCCSSILNHLAARENKVPCRRHQDRSCRSIGLGQLKHAARRDVCKNKQGPSKLDEPMLYSHPSIVFFLRLKSLY